MMTGKSNHLSLKFDMQGMIRDLTRWLTWRVDVLANGYKDSLNAMDYGYAKGTFRLEMMKQLQKEILIRVGSDHWYSFIIEYGRGSSMDRNNPFLNDYVGSKYWNPNRDSSFIIHPRPGGNWTVPNWEEGYGVNENYQGHGGYKAYNLEHKSGYEALSPNHFFTNMFKNTKRIFIDEIDATLKSFPFENYLKGGG